METSLQYVQFGCGMCAYDGWVNFDASPTLLFERIPLIGRLYTKNASRFPTIARYGNVVRGLPLDDNSCAGIYASHVLEHLALNDFYRAIANTYRYLAPGGRFRLIVPDLQRCCQEYLRTHDAHRLMRATTLGHENRPGWRFVLGHAHHLWMWDEKSMTEALKAAGFVKVRRAQFNDSDDPRFREVELSDRFVGCLGMEAVKAE